MRFPLQRPGRHRIDLSGRSGGTATSAQKAFRGGGQLPKNDDGQKPAGSRERPLEFPPNWEIESAGPGYLESFIGAESFRWKKDEIGKQ